MSGRKPDAKLLLFAVAFVVLLAQNGILIKQRRDAAAQVERLTAELEALRGEAATTASEEP